MIRTTALLLLASLSLPLFATPAATQPFLVPVKGTHIQNIHRVTDKIIAGAQPEDEADFKSLRDMGVKTILSVDGAKPDVATAHKFGLRYVHLPIGYDGVTDAQGKAIAKALQELPGRIYVHCHHGKHRSAAAVAVACVFNGFISPDQAERVLSTFGTGINYKGLWKAARTAKRIDQSELDALKIQYVEQAEIGPLADAMVNVDQTFDRVKLVKSANWQTPKNHPDLDPPHEALMLQEHFAEIARTDETRKRPADFRAQLTTATKDADLLRAILAADHPDLKSADAAFQSLSNSCANCHKSYRD